MDKNDKIMTLEEVAEYLRVKPQTIYTWAQENKIPAAKIGREWRFRKTVIDKWFDDQMNEKFRNY
jgi:excisionase family DNA binding protein